LTLIVDAATPTLSGSNGDAAQRGVVMSGTGVPPPTSETVDTGDPQGRMPGTLIYE
jgi:hypothetical protein